MGSMRYDKKEDDGSFPLQGLDKTQVIQESKPLFKKTPISSKKASFMIVKLLSLLTQGEKFTPSEASDIFFNATNLFVSKDEKVKRLLFILMKELSPDVEQAFMASNSLFQDMSTSKTEMRVYRANAIRALRKITDASLFGQLDRHLKQSVVDQDPAVASAALVAGLHLSQVNPDLVRRWVNERQAALKSPHHMVQYHALAVSYKLMQHDSLAVFKLVSSNTSSLRSPLAHSMLIRYASRILREENNRQGERTNEILPYLDSCLVYKNDMIILEAAKVLCSLEYLTPKEITPAITSLQSFLQSSARPVHKFAALRILNALANRFSILVSLVNNDLESIVEDDRSSKHLSTLAITTLLKTGNANTIDRLIKQIGGFMGSIPDDHKIVVIEAIKSLCVKYPKQFNVMLNFLSSALREEGGFPFKKSIVDVIIHLMDKIPESKEQGITHFCEFIEDCEFTPLLQQVLHYMGEVGPTLAKPSRCIRFIYNRVLLESAPVRASAIIAMAKFAAKLSELRPSIISILKRTLHDNDDEVRDRAVFYLKVLETGDEDLIRKMIIEELDIKVSSLEKTLVRYLQQNDYHNKFDTSLIAEQEREDAREESIKHFKQQQEATALGTTSPTSPATMSPTSPTATSPSGGAAVDYGKLFGKVPQLSQLGTPFKSSAPVPLTDADSDYVVTCTKHIFEKHIVFQFNCTNTVNAQRLENVMVSMEVDGAAGLSEDFAVQVSSLPYGATDSVFVCMTRQDIWTGTCNNVLQFGVREVDPETGESDDIDEEADADEYDLYKLPIRIVDYIRDMDIKNAFKEQWESLGQENEYIAASETPARESIQQSIDRVIGLLNLRPLNDRVASKKAHLLYFAGESIDGVPVLMAVKFSETAGTTTVQTAVRSTSEELRQAVTKAAIFG